MAVHRQRFVGIQLQLRNECYEKTPDLSIYDKVSRTKGARYGCTFLCPLTKRSVSRREEPHHKNETFYRCIQLGIHMTSGPSQAARCRMLWLHRWPRQATSIFLVRGSSRVYSEDSVCRLPISFEAHSHIAPGTSVHCVRQRSDVDLVEKSACTESGRQHLGHVVEERDRECRKGRVH